MRDLIDSVLIGGCASYLPFWIWNNAGDQLVRALAHSQTVACMEGVTKKDPQSCNSEGPKR